VQIFDTNMGLLRSAHIYPKIMSLNLRPIAVIFCSFFLLSGSAFAQKATIEADVKGVDGRPARGAEVRIERQDNKTAPVIAKTDGRGRSTATNLEAGTYKLTATVEGGVQSWLIVKTQAKKPILVEFDMRKTAAVANKGKKKYVWVAAETGTNVGGRWVEVVDQPETTGPSGRNIETLNGNLLNHPQYRTGMPGGGQ
jgi:hypothetical protein